MKIPYFSLAIPLFLGTATASPAPSFQARCEGLSQDAVAYAGKNVHLNFAQYKPAGSEIDYKAEGLNETCELAGAGLPVPMTVDLCRVGLEVETTDSSSIIMELWLPEKWEGRFLSTGTGGFSGCIIYSDMAYATSYGFATVGTNAGHNGTSGGAFYNQPEVLRDFVWRAVYTETVVGKDLTKQFYGDAAKKSYYMSCSNGGRQAFKSVQDHPELFDGVVAGAPALNWDGLLGRFGSYFHTLNYSSPDAYLPRTHWAAVHREVLRQCDHLDGALDNIVEDTRLCHPDLSPILCSNTNAEICLSEAQLQAVRTIFSPYVVDGKTLYPRVSPGAELAWFDGTYGGLPFGWALEWMRYVVYGDLSWEVSSFTDDDALAAKRLNPFNIDSWTGDLSGFRARGGKLLHWHGEQDQFIPIGGSDRYYDLVSRTMDASSAELDEFYRYFRVSGLQHCWGGNGASNIGQGYGFAGSDRSEDNVLMRIVDWVENGHAPETVRGAKFVDGNLENGIKYWRKHCKYPARNVYSGYGNGTDEEGWHCVEN